MNPTFEQTVAQRINHQSHWEPYRDQDPNDALRGEWNQMQREEQSREQLENYERMETYGD